MSVVESEAPEINRYRACRLGFSLAAIACGVIAFHAAGYTAYFFTAKQEFRQFFSSPDWMLFATTVITWSGFLGSMVLGRCWPNAYWRGQTTILVILSTIAAGIWVTRHAVRFQLVSEPVPYLELIIQLSMGLRWIWLAILSGLAAEVASHLGNTNVRPLRASALASITAGVAFWLMMFFIEFIPVAIGPGPAGQRAFLAIWLQLVGFWGFSCAAAFMTTVVLLVAARECGRLIRELRQREESGGWPTSAA